MNMFIRAGLALALTAFSGAAAQANTLTTSYASNNSNDGVMFDITVGANDLTITGFDLNLESAGATIPLEFYIKTGSHVGSENTSGDWSLVDTGSVVSAGDNVASYWDVSDYSLVAGGTYGIYLTALGSPNFNYFNGTAVGNVAAADGNLTIFEGTGKAYAFGGNFTPRVLSGGVEYTVDTPAVPLPATLPLLLAGLGGMGYVRRITRRA